MFRASSAHLQEVNDVNCTCMQPLVFSLCIKLVSIKELYYDARPTKSQDYLRMFYSDTFPQIMQYFLVT